MLQRWHDKGEARQPASAATRQGEGAAGAWQVESAAHEGKGAAADGGVRQADREQGAEDLLLFFW